MIFQFTLVERGEKLDCGLHYIGSLTGHIKDNCNSLAV